MRRGARAGAALPLLALAWGVPVQAVETGWVVGGGVEYSDNITRAEDDAAESGTIVELRAGYLLEAESTRLDAELETTLVYENYLEDRFDDGIVFEGEGALELALVPERVTWMARDIFQQIPQNSRAIATPGNEQDANAFITGPNLILPFGGVNALRLSARYGNFYFEETDQDSTLQALSASLARRVSPVTEVSINGRVQQIDFDQESRFQEDFVSHHAFLRYDRRLAVGEFTIDLGGYRIERDRLPDSEGALGRLSVDLELGATADVGLRVSTGSTTIGSALAALGDEPLSGSIEGIAVTGDVGQQDVARAFYRQEFGRLALAISGGAGEEDFEVADRFDREIRFAGIGLAYRLSLLRSAFAEASVRRVDYAIDNLPPGQDRTGDYTESSISIGLTQRLGRTLTLSAEFRHNRRRADGAGVDIEENIMEVSLVYGFGHPAVIGDMAAFDEDI